MATVSGVMGIAQPPFATIQKIAFIMNNKALHMNAQDFGRGQRAVGRGKKSPHHPGGMRIAASNGDRPGIGQFDRRQRD